MTRRSGAVARAIAGAIELLRSGRPAAEGPAPAHTASSGSAGRPAHTITGPPCHTLDHRRGARRRFLDESFLMHHHR
jgi:hypothetical protein